MINAAIVGLGWWGRTLVESTAGSDLIRFVAGTARTLSPDVNTFANAHQLRLAENYEALLTRTTVKMENFDLIGKWLDREGKTAIDATAQRVDGTKLDGPVSLRRASRGGPRQRLGFRQS